MLIIVNVIICVYLPFFLDYVNNKRLARLLTDVIAFVFW